MTPRPEHALDRSSPRRARRSGKVALREKKYGIWQEVSWAEYAAHVRAVCLGLEQLGLRRGDTLAIISGNRPAWLYAELAAQSLGAIPLGVYVDSLPDQVQLHRSSTARRASSWSRTRSRPTRCSASAPQLPRLERIVVDDMRGLEDYREPLLDQPRGRRAPRAARLDAREPGIATTPCSSGGTPDDVALLAYTSGTTGDAEGGDAQPPQPARDGRGRHRRSIPFTTRDEIVSFLPFSWVGEQLLSVAIALHVGATVSFPEEPETRARGPARDRAPRDDRAAALLGGDVLGVPGEDRRRRIRLKRRGDAGWRSAIGDAGGASEGCRASASAPACALLAGLAHLLRSARCSTARALARPLRLHRRRRARAGALPVLPRHRPQPQAGVRPDRDLGGICVLHPDGDVRAGDGGQADRRARGSGSPRRARSSSRATACSSATTRIPEATAQALDDGWLHTGDAGVVDDDGHLVVIDRLQRRPAAGRRLALLRPRSSRTS